MLFLKKCILFFLVTQYLYSEANGQEFLGILQDHIKTLSKYISPNNGKLPGLSSLIFTNTSSLPLESEEAPKQLKNADAASPSNLKEIPSASKLKEVPETSKLQEVPSASKLPEAPSASNLKEVPTVPSSDVNGLTNLMNKKSGPYCIHRSIKKNKTDILPYCVLSPEESISGRSRHGSVVHPTPFPPWMNIELARRGQEFASKNLYSVSMGALVGLLTGLAFPDARDVLCFTSNSDTTGESLKRYAATTSQMFIWFEEVLKSDPKNNALLKSITNVRGLHTIVAAKANAIKKAGGELIPPDKYKDFKTDDEMWDALVADLSTPHNLKYFKDFPVNYRKANSEAVYVNQFVQGVTLGGFIGFTIMYPESVYIYDATDDDLEAFMHLFAIIGYVVGVEDDYNMAIQPNAKEAKVYFKEMMDKFVVPALLQVEKKGKVLTESFIGGFYSNGTLPGQTSRTIMLRALRDFLKVDVPHMTAILNEVDARVEDQWDNTFVPTTHLPGTRLSMNSVIKASIEFDILTYFGPFKTNEERAKHVFYRTGL